MAGTRFPDIPGRAYAKNPSYQLDQHLNACWRCQYALLQSKVRLFVELRGGRTDFLDDPRAPIDNNQTERTLRGLVLDRK